MKLPNCERAIVAREKITEYLLSPVHRRGRQKAAFFMRFGFAQESWAILSAALLAHACAYDVTEVTSTEYGTLYCVEGTLEAPDERRPRVRSVWMIDRDSDTPRFISSWARRPLA